MPKETFSGAGVLMQDPGALAFRPDVAAMLLWEALERACRIRESPWRTPILSTVSPEGGAQARMLVMRAADSATRLLEFHSDSRSAKLKAITLEPRVELCFWDSAAQLQLRASGVATISADSARRESAWARVPFDSRKNYSGESRPGPIRCDPNPEAVHEEDGFANYAILDVELCRLEWLWLGATPHSRGQVLWEGGAWRARPLTP